MEATNLDSPARHRRSVGSLARAVFRREHYAAALKAITLCNNPADFLSRYIWKVGAYPTKISVRTPVGAVSLDVFSQDDVATINEIFFRSDYRASGRNVTVVDFGSNIGISAAFFLSRNHEAFCYCFEPVPRNADRLVDNLAQFAGRYELARAAVGETNGTVRFGWEPTGKYGGVERETGSWIEVECLDSNEQLENILRERRTIDILKVDIETLEEKVTRRLTPALRSRIRALVVEFPFRDNPLAETHEMTSRGYVTAFTARR